MTSWPISRFRRWSSLADSSNDTAVTANPKNFEFSCTILKSGVNTLLSPYVTFFISLSGATHIAYGCFRVILNCASSLYFMDLEYFQEFVKSTLNLFFDKIKIARSPTTPYLNSNRTKIYTRLCLSME